MDLYWLGRRDVADILTRPNDPGFASVTRIMNHYGDAAKAIADGSPWDHGFNAGALAAMRLVADLTTVHVDDEEFAQRADNYNMRVGKERIKDMMIHETRRTAVEDYPMLDS